MNTRLPGLIIELDRAVKKKAAPFCGTAFKKLLKLIIYLH
jgi:hypothetical protein